MKKKFMAILLGMMLMVPQVQWASESQKGNDLANAIVKVKAQINVPKELSEFTYSEYGGEYTLRWTNEADDQFINVYCETDGDILRYFYRDRNRIDHNGIAKVEYQKAKENAMTFLKQVAPHYVEKLRLIEEYTPNQSENYYFEYEVVENEIPLFNECVQVWVDKQTGEVTRFNGLSYNPKAQFESSTPKLSLEEAEKAYVKEIGINLAYKIYGGYGEKEKSFLAYELKDFYGMKAISAHTGKVVTHNRNREDGEYDTANTQDIVTSESADMAKWLTPEEQEEVNVRKDFIDLKTIQKNASVYFPVLKELDLTQSSNRKVEDHYIRQASFEKKVNGKATQNANLRFNAITGEILNYRYSKPITINEKKSTDKKWTEKEALNFVHGIAPETKNAIVMAPIDDDRVYNSRQDFIFKRTVNDIPVDGNGIYLTYDMGMKQVTSYSKDWSQISFPSPKGKVEPLQIAKNIGLELYYMAVENGKYALVYNHKEEGTLFDAFSGQGVDYDGQPLTKEEKTTLYSDIKGHPSEKVIQSLYYSGIYLDTKTLHPDAAITKGELFTLLTQASAKNETEAISEALSPLKVLSQKNNETALTKEEGIAYLVAASQYAKIAQKSEIFKYPYKDQTVNEELKGYIAIAYGLGWLGQTKELKSTEALTKAEAMNYIYNALADLREF